MIAFDAPIPPKVADYLQYVLTDVGGLEHANQIIASQCGISRFFESDQELTLLKDLLAAEHNLVEESKRSEYRDFQTTYKLACQVSDLLEQNGAKPQLLIEPTCGKGSFVIASLNAFPSLEMVVAVEIHKPYVWTCKFGVIEFFLSHPQMRKPIIRIEHHNVFEFDFGNVARDNIEKQVLVIGNPPWVTNSKLSSLESDNLPPKSNFKRHAGLDAITGKGNFDIAEYITFMMLDAFQHSNGTFAFLVKDSVIRNVVANQKKRSYRVAELTKSAIDSKREFNVAVDASLFQCKLNSGPDMFCTEADFYHRNKTLKKFGWVGDHFVSDMQLYEITSECDGESPFEWRQGLKHDLSSIMELQKTESGFINGLGQRVDIEDELVYPLVKSSDLRRVIIESTRKYVIVTQKHVGQDTSFLEQALPRTFNYLNQSRAQFKHRKSTIYRNRPDFSIFGIGDYSFSPYKVGVSGLYKQWQFSLVLPLGEKPVMLDDTCYMLGFDTLDFAAYAAIVLNSPVVREFLRSVSFQEAKRVITKELLMRIDLLRVVTHYTPAYLLDELTKMNRMSSVTLNLDSWSAFLKAMKPAAAQIALF